MTVANGPGPEGGPPAALASPAIIATFYGPADSLDTLRNRAVSQWADGDATPRMSYPPAAHDATVLHVALNAGDDAVVEEAWPALTERLRNLLDGRPAKDMWGYSLVYQADIIDDGNLAAAMKRLLPHVTGAGPTSGRWREPLAQAVPDGGLLWLLHVPTQGKPSESETVYVAASRSPDLVFEVLYGPAAKLLMPDLIAHKAYNLVRQNRARVHHYEGLVAALREITGDVLDHPEHGRQSEVLDQLARGYDSLSENVPKFEAARISLAQQAHNFEWWRKRRHDIGEVLDFHREHLETGLLEAELLVAKGQSALQAASTAAEMVRTCLEKDDARRQERIATWLAVIAIAFSAPELIDRDAAGALLDLALGPGRAYDLLALLGVQIAIVILLVVVVALPWRVRKLSSRRRRTREREAQ